MRRTLQIATSLSCLACTAARVPVVDASAHISIGPPLSEVDERFLSVAVDAGQVVGTKFWDAGAAAYDFSRPRLLRLARELAPAYLRIGGTDADRIYYDMGNKPLAAPSPYSAVLTRAQWDAAGDFARAAGFSLFFTLNAGRGPRDSSGSWRPDNARALLEHARERGDPVALWELGNELNGFLIMHGLVVGAQQYARDLAAARALIDEADPGALLGGPAVAYWPVLGEFFPFLENTLGAGGGGPLDVVTWHFYPQQSRRCPMATRRAGLEVLLSPKNLDEVGRWAAAVEQQRDAAAPGKQVWLGETGSAQCGGEPGVSDAFASGFWWVDELGQMARRGEPVVVRQSLSGSDYGLLDDVTLSPRPDYWVSVLWKRLMGTVALQVEALGHPLLRVYAHCARGRPGAVAMAFANLDTLPVSLHLPGGAGELYELTADSLSARELRLNGVALAAAPDGSLPPLSPRAIAAEEIAPRSYGFVVLPDASADCR